MIKNLIFIENEANWTVYFLTILLSINEYLSIMYSSSGQMALSCLKHLLWDRLVAESSSICSLITKQVLFHSKRWCRLVMSLSRCAWYVFPCLLPSALALCWIAEQWRFSFLTFAASRCVWNKPLLLFADRREIRCSAHARPKRPEDDGFNPRWHFEDSGADGVNWQRIIFVSGSDAANFPHLFPLPGCFFPLLFLLAEKPSSGSFIRASLTQRRNIILRFVYKLLKCAALPNTAGADVCCFHADRWR